MGQTVSRARILRISIILAVLVIGATAGGVYIYRAATDGSQPEAAADAGATDPANHADEASDTAADQAAEGESETEEDGDTPIPVSVSNPDIGSVSTYISATANLVPDQEVRVLSEAEGRVSRLLVEEGDQVEAGQLLAELLRDEVEIAVNKARLKADNARMAFERAEQMHAEHLIAQEEFDRVDMDHRIAQQELAEATWRLERTQIRAPFAGRLTRRDCTLGQHVRPGDELFTVTDFDPLIARIYLPEKEVLTLEKDREVRIALNADETVRFPGRIRQISPVVDTETGTVKVTIAAIRPPRAVRPGGFVTVDITRETRRGTMLVPKDAVIRELKKAHVFVAKESAAEKRTVTLGLEEGESVEIVSGVERDEQIVVAGQGGLEDGSKIKVLPDHDTEAQAAERSEAADRPTHG